MLSRLNRHSEILRMARANLLNLENVKSLEFINLIILTSRAHWLLAGLTLNEQNLKPAKFSMIQKIFDV